MVQDPKERINEAVHECIQRCHGSERILARIEQYLDDLRQRPDWLEYEVQIVDARVRKLVRGMIEIESGCAAPDQRTR